MPKTKEDIILEMKMKAKARSEDEDEMKAKARSEEEDAFVDDLDDIDSRFSGMNLNPKSKAANTPKARSLGTPFASSQTKNAFEQTKNAFDQFKGSYPEFENHHLVNVKGDGNCFFRALSFLLFEDEDNWAEVKRQLVRFFRKNFKSICSDYNLCEDDLHMLAGKDEHQSEVALFIAHLYHGSTFGLIGYGFDGKKYEPKKYGPSEEVDDIDWIFFCNHHFSPLEVRMDKKR